MTRECDCADWIPGIKAVSAAAITEQARACRRIDYAYIPWRYCPWCGAAISTHPKLTHDQGAPV